MKIQWFPIILLICGALFLLGCARHYSSRYPPPRGGPGYSRGVPRVYEHRHPGGHRLHSHRDEYGRVFRHRH